MTDVQSEEKATKHREENKNEPENEHDALERKGEPKFTENENEPQKSKVFHEYGERGEFKYGIFWMPGRKLGDTFTKEEREEAAKGKWQSKTRLMHDYDKNRMIFN